MEDVDTTLNKVRRDFIRPKPDLVINKVPKDVLINFKSFAESNFNGDYGFTLKWLWDFYLPKNYDLEKRVETLESAIGGLLNKQETDDSDTEIKTIKLGNGKTLKLNK